MLINSLMATLRAIGDNRVYISRKLSEQRAAFHFAYAALLFNLRTKKRFDHRRPSLFLKKKSVSSSRIISTALDEFR